jgi:molybdopterin molybdotransferase
VREHALAIGPLPRASEAFSLFEDLNRLLGRVLAAPVVADRDQPPFPRSTRDGFACRAADLATGASLCVIGQLRAGQVWTGPALQPGETIEIMTGAPVPPGADCILMVEHAIVGDLGAGMRPAPGRVLAPGENIVPAGAEARSGATLIAPGTRIGPQHIAIAAACGSASLTVYKLPRVAILATGDELVPLGQQPLPHQIRNSNSYSIAAQVLAHGGEPVLAPIVGDSLSEIETAIQSVLVSGCDLVILSGGVSMGQYDFVEQALLNLQAEFFFTGVRIQPGRPVVFGRLPANGRPRYFFGLPGNPVSTLVTFALFAAPLLAALAGDASLGPHFVEARLASDVRAKTGLTRFLPARIESDNTGATLHPLAWQGSGDQSAASRANVFVVVPEDASAIAAGERVSALLL